MRVKVQPQAQEEFIQISQELARENLAAADELAAAFVGLCERIGEFPESATVYYRDVRKALIPKFRVQVYYRVLDAIEIVFVVDGRRDPASIAGTLARR